MSRVSSSGSPTQCSATLSPLPSSTCRSTQLYAALRVPPTNHLAKGGSSQSRTRSHFWSQERRSACFSQKASRSSAASSYQSVVTLACSTSSAGGSKRRSSWLRLARVSLLTVLFPPWETLRRACPPEGCDPVGSRSARCHRHQCLPVAERGDAAERCIPGRESGQQADEAADVLDRLGRD